MLATFEAAAKLNCSRQRVQELVKLGRLQPYTPEGEPTTPTKGKAMYFREEDIDNFQKFPEGRQIVPKPPKKANGRPKKIAADDTPKRPRGRPRKTSFEISS
jgi:Helix-turn-helix domain/AT hook motif